MGGRPVCEPLGVSRCRTTSRSPSHTLIEIRSATRNRERHLGDASGPVLHKAFKRLLAERGHNHRNATAYSFSQQLVTICLEPSSSRSCDGVRSLVGGAATVEHLRARPGDLRESGRASHMRRRKRSCAANEEPRTLSEPVIAAADHRIGHATGLVELDGSGLLLPTTRNPPARAVAPCGAYVAGLQAGKSSAGSMRSPPSASRSS